MAAETWTNKVTRKGARNRVVSLQDVKDFIDAARITNIGWDAQVTVTEGNLLNVEEIKDVTPTP